METPHITYKSSRNFKDQKITSLHFTSLTHFTSLHFHNWLGGVVPRTSPPTTSGVGGRQRRVREAGALTGYGAPAVSTPGLGSRASRARLQGLRGTFKRNDKKLIKMVPKRARSRAKTWSFEWKIESRPTYGDFEKKNLDPQLHQIFKPIRKFFCTFLPIYQFKLRTPLKHIKVLKKYKTKKWLTFFTHFTSLHFTHSLTHFSQLTWGSRTGDATDDNFV